MVLMGRQCGSLHGGDGMGIQRVGLCGAERQVVRKGKGWEVGLTSGEFGVLDGRGLAS